MIEYDSWSPRNEEEQVVSVLKEVQSPNQLKFLDEDRRNDLFSVLKQINSLEELLNYSSVQEATELTEWAHRRAYDLWVKKEKRRAVALKRRITYLPEPIIYWH